MTNNSDNNNNNDLTENYMAERHNKAEALRHSIMYIMNNLLIINRLHEDERNTLAIIKTHDLFIEITKLWKILRTEQEQERAKELQDRTRKALANNSVFNIKNNDQ